MKPVRRKHRSFRSICSSALSTLKWGVTFPEKKNEISYKVIGATIEVHKILGDPGLLEGVYESCLCRELDLQGLKVQRQVEVPVIYKGTAVREPLFIDILVENRLIIEVKAAEKEIPIIGIGLEIILNVFFQKTGTSSIIERLFRKH